jgi:hypothetical protein
MIWRTKGLASTMIASSAMAMRSPRRVPVSAGRTAAVANLSTSSTSICCLEGQRR